MHTCSFFILYIDINVAIVQVRFCLH